MRRFVLALVLELLLVGVWVLPVAARDRVTLQLCWDHQFQFAGYYAALWKGYYDEADLDVELRGALEKDFKFLNPTEEVASGRAHFGVGEANILVAMDQGAPLVILASIFQHSGVELYARLDANLESPAQLEGMRILRRDGDLGEVQLQAMLLTEGMDPKKLTFLPMRKEKSSAASLRDGDIDVILGYSLTTPYLLDKAGVRATKLRPSMYGIDFYGDSLFTTETLVQKNPALVDRFVKASIKGWRYALANPEEIALRISSDLPRIFPPKDDILAFNQYQSEGVLRLCDYQHTEIGHINPERWAFMAGYLRQSGMMTGDIDLGRVIYDPVRRKEEADHRFHRSLYVGLAILLGAAGFIGVWGFSLRRVVALRTAELVAANSSLRREVAERTRIEADLRVSEAFYRTIFENTGMPLVIIEEDGGISRANSEFSKLVGYSRQEIEAGMPWTDFFHGRFRETMGKYHRLLRLEPGKAPRSYDAELCDRRGDLRYVYVTMEVIPGTTQSVASHLDITGRRLVEDALRRSEERYRAIFENAPAGIFRTTREGRYLDANPELAAIYGYDSPQDLLDTVTDIGLQIYVDPADRAAFLARLEQEGQVSHFETPRRRKDGGEIWVSCSARVVRDSLGAFSHIEGFVTDVTPRRRAETALRASEAQKQAILDASVDVIMLVDTSLGIVWANQTAGERLGLSPRGILGQYCHGALWGGDEPCPGCPCRKALETGRIERATMRRCNVGGREETYWETYGVPLRDEAGEVVGAIEIARDVTESKRAEMALRESEARYRTITENFPGGILLMDRDFTVQAANSTMRRWFPEIGSARQIKCFALRGRQDRCPGCPGEAVLADGQVQTSVKEFEIAGETRIFRVIACPMPGVKGGMDRIMVIYSDVTEETKLNERLRNASRADLVATMGSGIAHEVNQPLNALKLWVTGLMMLLERDKDVGREVLAEQLGKIQRAADRIANVVDHMRMLIRLGDKAHTEPTDLNAAVNSALGMVSAKLSSHGVLLGVDLDDSRPLVVANPIQLEQVVINLVANALDAHDTVPGNGKRIDITTRRGGGRALLVVEDNGPGFKGDIRRIFDPFYTTKQVGEGMGLGLSLVQAFVTSWGGEISAHAPGSRRKGARMVAELPLAQPPRPVSREDQA
ncbi:MAG: PAS domain S-box protein [Thermodesulfobacteriota bacterium]